MRKSIALLLALIMCLSLCACGSNSSSQKAKNCIIDAYVTTDSEAVIVNDKGDALKVPGDEKVSAASLTADRDHIVVLYENGDLSVFNSSMEKETKIASNVDGMLIRDTGIYYSIDVYAGLTVDSVLKTLLNDMDKDVEDTDTEDADTEDADAEDADIEDVDVEDIDAEDADTEDADTEDADTEDADIEDTDTENVDAEDVEVEDDDLTVADLKDYLEYMFDDEPGVEEAIALYNYLTEEDYCDVYKLKQKFVRYLFDSEESFEISADIGETIQIVVADDNLNAVYSLGDKVYSVLEKDAEAIQLGSKKADYIEPIAISSVTGQAVWADYSEDITTKESSYSYYSYNTEYNYDTTYYTFENDDTVKLGESTSSNSYGYGADVYFTDNGKSLMLVPSDGDKLFTWSSGEDSESHSLGGDIGYTIYTADGRVDAENESSIDGIYYGTTNSDDSSLWDLYYMNFAGDRDKVISGISSYYIIDGNLYYIKEDVLYVATLDGSELGEAEKIASDTYKFSIMSDGETVAYIKDYSSDDGGQLFIKSSGKDAEKVASDVVKMYCADDNTLLYIKDTKDIKDTYSECGELYSYTRGKEAEKIASDIVVGSLEDGTTDYYFDADALRFAKFDRVSDGDMVVTMLFFNGKEATNVVDNVLY